MKKFIAVLLCFAVIFAFAACTKNPSNDESTTEPTGKPGEWVTDANGEVQTVTTPYLVLDDKGEPQTGEDGKPLTTTVFEIETYPPAEGETLPPQTTVPTVPAGNTVSSDNLAWPAQEFMAKLPKAADKVDKATYHTNDDGSEQLATIYINEMTYEAYKAFLQKCTDAGFVQRNTGKPVPEKLEAGKNYVYLSVANGLYVTVSYYTDEYPYRNCDVLITVANYDVGNVIERLEGAKG